MKKKKRKEKKKKRKITDDFIVSVSFVDSKLWFSGIVECLFINLSTIFWSFFAREISERTSFVWSSYYFDLFKY